MHSYSRAGRLALVVGLCCTLAACGWIGKLKGQQAFKDANAAYKAQDYKKAAEPYEEAMKLDPEHDIQSAYFYLGNSYDNLYKPSAGGRSRRTTPC